MRPLSFGRIMLLGAAGMICLYVFVVVVFAVWGQQ